MWNVCVCACAGRGGARDSASLWGTLTGFDGFLSHSPLFVTIERRKNQLTFQQHAIVQKKV